MSPQSKEKIKAVISLDELRDYSVVQGLGWGDNEILRANGFRVIELDGYQNLFQMVASGRADLFCRGFNELFSEYMTNKEMKNLLYDESFLLKYEMSYFLYIHKTDVLAKQRLEEGLQIAYEDRSAKRLWLNRFGGSITFAKLNQRKFFRLGNSKVKKLSTEYKKYLVDPTSVKKFDQVN